jgi:hypothetical protein
LLLAKGDLNETAPLSALNTIAGCNPPQPILLLLLPALLLLLLLVGDKDGSCHDGLRASASNVKLGDGQSRTAAGLSLVDVVEFVFAVAAAVSNALERKKEAFFIVSHSLTWRRGFT